MRPFLPGSTIGIMGGGQLGRMLAMAAHRMGYRVHSFSPGCGTPAGSVCEQETAAEYDDREAVERFARGIDVLTFEFENIPVETVAWCEAQCVVRPAGEVLRICQHRLREKQFLAGAGIPLPKFRAVADAAELEQAVAEIGRPSVLKTACFGYDGRGQRKIEPESNLEQVWSEFAQPAVLEAWVPYEMEASIIVARGVRGELATYPVCENLHRNHILDVTQVPARVSPVTARAAGEIACAVAEALGLIGLLAVEMFILPGGEILVNELAPRPHNSGHFSFDAAVTSQFEQQVRAVCGLPLGSTELLRPCAMANLLGEVWQHGEPDWSALLALPEVKLHLYGKAGPRPGRKMGHLLAFGEDAEAAAARVCEARALL